MVLFWTICIPVGFIVGAILGCFGAGYVIIYMPLHYAETAARAHEWSSMVSFVVVLMFGKVGIALGGLLGGVLGCIPSVIGLWKLEKECDDD